MTILALLLLLAAGAIAFFNMEPIALSLYFMAVSVPTWLVILGSVLVGLLAGLLFAGARASSSQQDIHTKEKELQDKLDQKEDELQSAKRETQEVADRTRQETEMNLQMKQKDEEIQALRRRLGLLEEETQQKQAPISRDASTTHIGTKEEVVVIPDSRDEHSGRNWDAKNYTDPDSSSVKSETAVDPNQANVVASEKETFRPKDS